jgi:hypothetical protein
MPHWKRARIEELTVQLTRETDARERGRLAGRLGTLMIRAADRREPRKESEPTRPGPWRPLSDLRVLLKRRAPTHQDRIPPQGAEASVDSLKALPHQQVTNSKQQFKPEACLDRWII